MRAADAAGEKLMEFTATPNAPTVQALAALQVFATEQTARLIGCGTLELEWWWLENAYGAKGMACGLRGESPQPMTTLAEYAQFMAREMAWEMAREMAREAACAK